MDQLSLHTILEVVFRFVLTVSNPTLCLKLKIYPRLHGHFAFMFMFHIFYFQKGQNHPNPGQSYVANGFPRTCYLPNNEKGKKVL